MKQIILISAMLFLCLEISAQRDTTPITKKLFITAKYDQEGVRLKFIPPNGNTWLKTARNGFNIERKELGRENNSKFIKLNSKPILPFSETDWQQVSNGSEHFKTQEELLGKALNSTKKANSPSDYFKMAEGLKQLFGFYLLWTTSDPIASQGSGLEFLDATAKSGKTYQYRITTVNLSITEETSGELVYTTNFEGLPQPILQAQEGDLQVQLEWEHIRLKSPFIAYILEKSEDSKQFKQLTDGALYYNSRLHARDSISFHEDRMYFRDSLEDNGKTYFYRLTGMDYFGELSPVSSILRIVGKDQTPPIRAKSLTATLKEDSTAFILKWEKESIEKDLEGMVVVKSFEVDGEYAPVHQTLLPTNTTSFEDKDLSDGKSRYYRVLAFNRSGNYAASIATYAFLPDENPPAIPTKLSFKADSNGLVIINWTPNKEEDLKGYKIFKSTELNGSYVCVSPVMLQKNQFVDSVDLNLVSHDYFYKVIALDQHYNQSDYSETLKVEVPDIKPPVAALLTDLNNENGQIDLKWGASSSHDLAKYEVLFKSETDKNWTILDLVSKNVNTYSAKAPQQTGTYSYAIKAIDEAGLNSISNSKYLKIRIKQSIPPVEDLNFYPNKQNGVTLEWKYEGEGLNYLIYRSVGDGKPRLYQSSKTAFFVEKELEKGVAYQYQVVAQGNDGKRSVRSELVEVRF